MARSSSWQRWFTALPFVLLSVGTVIALATERAQGHGARRTSLMVAVVVLTAVVLVLGTRARRRAVVGGQRTSYVVRTVLAFTLAWLNPFFAIFAFVGYLDAFDVFRRRWALLGMGVTALTVAGAQSGGLPPRDGTQWTVFGVLVVFNATLASAFTAFHDSVERTSEQRAATITALERVNAELQQALRENAALTDALLAQAREAGVTEERQRLAREIHDTLAQDLAAILTQLQALRDAPDPAGRRLEIAYDTAREALVEARRSVQDLSPARLVGASLPRALETVVTGWRDKHGASADLVVTGHPVPQHADVEATVIRVVQEALANVAKHADASRVGITLSYADDELLVDVRDDGCGFDPAADCCPHSFGLKGMRQRTEAVAGVLAIESATGSGTALSLRLPAVPAGSSA